MAHNGTRKLHRSPAYELDVGHAWMASRPQARARRGVGFRERLEATLDRVVLAMAVAGAQDDPAMLDPLYAENMLLLFEAYCCRTTTARKTVEEESPRPDMAPR